MKFNKLPFLLLLSFLTSFFSTAPAFASFKDVDETYSYHEAISSLEEQGVIAGHNGFFMPEQPITRAELLKMAFSHIKYQPVSRNYDTKFKDVPADSWFAPYVAKAFELGAININPDIPSFFPDAPISRLESLKIIMSIEGIPISFIKDQSPLIFIDVKPGAPFAYLIRAAQNSGIYIARKDNKFLPFNTLTRGEAAEFLYLAEQYRESGATGTVIIQAPAYFDQYSETENQLLENSKFSIFLNAWGKINNDYLNKDTVNQDDLVYGAINGMVNSLDDPYSIFDPPSEAKDLQDSLEGTYEGIGTVMDKYENDYIIVSVIKDSPAEKAGLKAGDLIKQIDGKTVNNLSGEELVNLIKGPADSQVKLTIDRNGQTLNFTITRAQVTLDSVIQQQSQVKIPDQIGFISISQFSNSTGSQFDDILNDIMTKKPKALILDLRNNPGGYLDPAYNILGHFVENGKTIMFLKISGQDVTQNSDGNGELKNLPLAVLINKNSASAAEVVAGCLQDYKIAKLIGEQSYGKGTVQEVTTYLDGSLLKLTVAKWYTPLKRTIDKTGLTPDIAVTATKDDILGTTDSQLQRAIDELQKVI